MLYRPFRSSGLSRPLGLFMMIWLMMPGLAQAQEPAYATAVWEENSIHLLDENLDSIGSFPAGQILPNGIAFDGTYIYSAHFIGASVYAYEPDGTVAFSWSDPSRLDQVQSLTYIQATGELAFGRGDVIWFVNPADGSNPRQVSQSACSNMEAAASDGANGIWLLCPDGLYLMDISTGNQLATSAKPTAVCNFGGTAMARGPDGLLVLGCADGRWFVWDPAAGVTVASGNNGLEMFGLTELSEVVRIDPLPVPLGSLPAWLILMLLMVLLAKSAGLRSRQA